MIKKICAALVMFMPWALKRYFLTRFWGYDIDKQAYIGLSYIYPDELIMKKGARIGHLNVAIHLHRIFMDIDCSISQRNWITGYPKNGTRFFTKFSSRRPELLMLQDSAITKQHIIDCTDLVTIGAYSSIAGYRTQILTHSTSLKYNDQSCKPITIGHHCFVGTSSIILPGAVLPDQSVLGAGSVLNKRYEESLCLYGGIPARLIKKVDGNDQFFTRTYRPKGILLNNQ